MSRIEIEVRGGHHPKTGQAYWYGIVKIDPLVSRNRSAFACLFGVNNRARFRPIAAGRGLPSDVSDDAERDFEEWYTGGDNAFGPTWVSWLELKAVDWDGRLAGADTTINECHRDRQGQVELRSSDLDLGWLVRYRGLKVAAPSTGVPVGTEWEVGGSVYRVERWTRGNTLSRSGWDLVFTLMDRLAERYRNDGVRLVVWFDG